jgi:hypothetical protein
MSKKKKLAVEHILDDHAQQVAEQDVQQTSGSAGEPTQASGKETQSAQLLRLALADDAEYFHSPDGKAFATMPIDEKHIETATVRSKGFRNWLAREYYRETAKAPSAKNLLDVIGVLEARARYDGKLLPVYHRVGGVGDVCCLDLCSPSGRSVVITKDGWELTDKAPVRMRRPRGLLPLPEPVRDGSLQELRQFVNVQDEGWPLAVAWVVQALRPSGPYPILGLHGEHGAAKSTTARALRSLIDPSIPDLRAQPKDERDLAVAANNCWVLALDNLSHIEPWLSDALCRLSTGGGLATRELYSDDDEAIFNFQRPLILNGIEDVASRADLLDRSIVLHLPNIDEERRLPESLFWQRFEEARPRLLGALLDAVVAALRNLPSTNLDRLPRMADFACWVHAAETALPWEAGKFLEAYRTNRAEAIDVALESSPVITPLREFVEQRTLANVWTGPCHQLLDELNGMVTEKQRQSKQWPATARALSGILRRLAPCLRAVGVKIDFGQRGRKGRPVTLFRSEPKQEAQQAQEAEGNGKGEHRHHVHPPSPDGENQMAADDGRGDGRVTVDGIGDGSTVTPSADRHHENPEKTHAGDGGVCGDGVPGTYSPRPLNGAPDAIGNGFTRGIL